MSPILQSLTTAGFTATLGLLLKVYFDERDRKQKSKSLAAALAGEIGAYLELSNARQLPDYYRKMAKSVDAVASRGATPDPPTGHPVFDAVAGDLGLLTTDLAKRVSEFYNVVSVWRSFMRQLKSSDFNNMPAELRVRIINNFADLFEPKIDGFFKLLDDLERFSD